MLGEGDIYYPDLQLPERTNYNIGKFGHMRCEYLKEFKHGYYMKLLLEGKLNEYLHDIDEARGKDEGKTRCDRAVKSGESDDVGGEDE